MTGVTLHSVGGMDTKPVLAMCFSLLFVEVSSKILFHQFQNVFYFIYILSTGMFRNDVRTGKSSQCVEVIVKFGFIRNSMMWNPLPILLNHSCSILVVK